MGDGEAIPLPPGSRSITKVDKTYYTWSTLFRGMLGRASQTEIRGYNTAFDSIYAEKQCRRCEENRDWLFQYSPLIRFLRQECANLGGNLGPHNIYCRNCTALQRGGFDAEYGILLCANEESTRTKVEETMAHELVHAYDHLRWKFDGLNMKHAACTEIRASMLSGECRYTRQKQWVVMGKFQDCVRKRAALSLAARPQIDGDMDQARALVDSVWLSCFTDTRPFDEIFR